MNIGQNNITASKSFILFQFFYDFYYNFYKMVCVELSKCSDVV